MDNTNAHELRPLLQEALEQLRSALNLLDDGHAPAQIGARVDMAIHELSTVLTGPSGEPSRV